MAVRRSLDFLPTVFQTTSNKRFLNATIDQLIQEPSMTRMASFVGRGEGSPTYRAGDAYLQEGDSFSQYYQLEPSLAVRKRTLGVEKEFKIDNVYSYLDMLNKLSSDGGITDDHDRLFRQEYYNYQGFVELDKLVNYRNYFWVPSGPNSIDVYAGDVELEKTFFITIKGTTVDAGGLPEQVSTDYGHQVTGFSNDLNPTITLVRGGRYQFDVSQSNLPFYIQTEPGDLDDASDYVSWQQNISKREVKGVDNNGEDSGSIVFTVPRKDAQDQYISLTEIDPVDLVLDIPFNQVQNVPLNLFLETNTFDSIKTDATIKRVIFTDTSDDNWYYPGNYDSELFDSGSFDQGLTVDKTQRKGVWQMKINDENVIKCSYIEDLPVNNKVFIKEGAKYGNRYLYKDGTLTLKLVPVLTATLDTLYYQTTNFGSGVIKLIEADLTSKISIDDIVGQKRYTSPNGVRFTNGLKVKFTNIVEPESYKNNEYIVDGVGKSIKLINWNNLVTPETYSVSVGSGFDASGEEYDNTNYDSTLNAPTSKEYITISRASTDGNPWSRGNRWFHKDILDYTAATLTPGVGYSFDEGYRAKRPVIEFLADLRLFNGSSNYATPVDVIDTTQTDAFSIVEGAEAYFIDGVPLNSGLKVLFTADADSTVRKTVYTILKYDRTGAQDYQIHLIPTYELADEDSVVSVTGVVRQGQWWKYSDASGWSLCQQKTSVSQAPLFDVFVNGSSMSDSTIYPGSSFIGSKLFSYKPGSITDTELGIPISYRSLGNIGDILFQNDFVLDTFTYNLEGQDTSVNVNIGNPKIKDATGTYVSKNPWTKIVDLSKQFIEQKFTATLNKKNDFFVTAIFKTSRTERNVFVWLNGVKTTEFKIFADANKNRTILRFDNDLAVNDRIIIKIFGSVTVQKNFYIVPKNLERNSFNDDFETITLGQMREHLTEMSVNSLEMQGNSNGDSNLRDIDYAASSGTILQHSAPFHLAQLFTNNPSTDIVKAISISRQEYSRFRDKFLDLLITKDFRDPRDSRSVVDAILIELSAGADNSMAFYYTDMTAFGSDYTKTSYTVMNTFDKTFNAVYSYGFDTVSDLIGSPYKSILVYYKSGTGYSSQLLINKDYTLSGRIITLSDSFIIQQDDTIELYEYPTTKGCLIPATPTKLGMYPKFQPRIFLDETYLDPITVIEGHDGSITPAFSDFRDQAILELEKRIYNNLRVDYKETLPDHYSVAPGAFRQTGYSFDEWTQLLSSSFMSWAGTNSLDIYVNNIVSNDLFSLNYSQATDKVFDELLPGYWRAIYNYFYDTNRPNTAPWEMLGYSEKPVYWESRYGPSPYTAGNLVLWEDLELGVYYTDTNDDGSYVNRNTNSLFARPGLLEIIPVDDHGLLLPPQTAIVKKFNSLTGGNRWRFGDQGPVESAWRRSINYPYAVMEAYALARPAEFTSYTFNLRDYKRVSSLGQVINDKTNNRKTTSVISDDTNLVPGSNVWLRDRLAWLGLDVQENLVYLLEDVSLNLSYKMAGFTDKEYLQVIAEQSSPDSLNTGVLVPQENYDVVLTKSAPTSRVTYSAVIVEKQSNGYAVRGFDTSKPYFVMQPSLINNNNYAITVGDSSAVVYKDGDDKLLTIPYGTNFTSKQQVVDFLISYGRYLTIIGFKFDDVLSDSTTRKDWTLAAKEFLFFTQQAWDDSTIISLTPTEASIKFDNGVAVVEDMTDSYNGTRIISSNNKVIPSSDYRVYRDGTSFEVALRDTTKGIHLIDLQTVQYEHSLIFDNKTVFNDVIYQANLGNRQQRLKIVGRKTKGWNGSLSAPGFLVNHRVVQDWTSQTDYYKGEIVKHKGKYFTANNFLPGAVRFDQNDWYEIQNTLLNKKLIPTPTFNSQQFEGFYDVDLEDVNVTADLQARHATGFQKRNYLTDIGLDTISQHKFYLGMTTEKGTKTSIDKFLRAKLPYLENNLNIREEWAIKVGDYGNVDNVNQIEVPLSNVATHNEIAVIELLNVNDAKPRNWNSFKPKDLVYIPNVYDKDIFLKTSGLKTQIPTAGPVLLNEVSATVYDVNKIENIGTLAAVMGEGSRIWVASDLDNDWGVYRASNDYGLYATKIQKINDSEIEFLTPRPHGLALRDKVLIKNAIVNVQNAAGLTSISDVSGVFRVTAISENRFRVQTGSANVDIVSGAIKALVFKLQNVRYSNRVDFAQDTPYRGWKAGDKAYIDYTTSGWQVLENQNPWNYVEYQSPLTVTASDDLGRSMLITDNQLTMAISSSENNGKVYVYGLDDFDEWNLLQSIEATDSGTSSFGNSLSSNDDNKLFIGDPDNGGIGAVYVATISAGLTEFDQVIYDPTLLSGAEFGRSVAASKDGRWLYISAAGDEEIHAYQLVTVDTATTAYTADGSTAIFLLPIEVRFDVLDAEQVKVFVGTDIQVPYIDYVMNAYQTGVTFTVAPADGADVTIEYSDYYLYVDFISSPSAIVTGFGGKVVTSTDGQQILVSAPNDVRYDNGQAYTDVGAVYIFKRTVENFISAEDQVTYTTDYPVNSARVTVDSIALTDSEYSQFAGSVVLTSAPILSSVVSVESNYFQLITKLSPSSVQADMLYGTDVILCPNNCSIYVGSPYYRGISGDKGVVYRHVNVSKIYGEITGTVVEPTVTVGNTVSINNYHVTFTGTSLDSVIADINDSIVPGVTASKTTDGKLRLATDSQLTFNKLTVTDVYGNSLDTFGINMFREVQTIESTYQEDGLSFGETLAINQSADKLIVGTTKSSSYAVTTFDLTDTSFDSTSTLFRDKLKRSGGVFLYEYQQSSTETSSDIGQFAYATNFVNDNLTADARFGRNVSISNNWLMIASPKGAVDGSEKGLFYIYNNPAAESVWNISRVKAAEVDSNKISRAFIYDDNLQQILAELPIVDMQIGKLLPDIAQGLDFITNYDPAIYNVVPTNVGFNYDRKTAWGKYQVGKLWWDTNSVKYLDWQQDTLLSKASLRDIAFPSSSFDVYEWVESSIGPIEYAKANSTRGLLPLYTKNEVYTQIIDIDEKSNQTSTKYFFWVKHLPSVIEAGNDRVSSLIRSLSNPRATKIPFASVIASNAIALYNCTDLIGHDRVLRIVYDKELQNVPVHTEWSVYKDGSRLGLDESVFNKLVDSIAEQDAQGRPVPDLTLKEKQRYGLSVRPRQTVFNDSTEAKRYFWLFANTLFAEYPIRLVRSLDVFNSYDPYPLSSEYDELVETDIELGYLDTALYINKIILVKSDSTTGGWTLRKLETVNQAGNLVDEWTITKAQTYDNRLYWEYTDWYASGYSSDTIPDYQVDFSYELSQLGLRNNNVVKIRNGASGGWQLIKIKEGKIELVAQQDATIRLKTNIYDTVVGGFGIDDRSFELTGFSVDNSLEVRNLFVAFTDMLTTNAGVLVSEFRKKYDDFMNDKMTLIAKQFREMDWLFKTSFISIDHTIRNLDQIPVYVKQPEQTVQDYINEIKPYHTKIRRYTSTYPGTDQAPMFSTDFDLSSYLNSDGVYKSPNIEDPVDQYYLSVYPAKSWTDNYLNEVGYVDVIDGGTGYASNTLITFLGGGGSGAKGRAKVSNGGIVSVIMDNYGQGYSTPPDILIEGTGLGAVLIAKLQNNKVRTIKSKIIFDRYTYNYTIEDWEVNTSYVVDDIFLYNYQPYRVIESFTSTTQIDLVNVVPYRFMRWEPRTRYSVYDLVVTDWADGTVYEVATDHISPSALTIDYLRNYMVSVNLVPIPYTGVIMDNAGDRIWSYYQAASGQPGRDLAQLMKGIEYPGVKVLGPGFDQEPGFDVSNYDTTLFDNLEYDSEGLAIIGGTGSLDTTYYSLFTDSNLGIRAEDIITDGSGFVDTYSSHAPEELVPGSIFDALDIKVTTIADGDLEGDGSGPEIAIIGTTANSDTVFPFDGNLIGGIEKLIVSTKEEGYKTENIDFTVDWVNKQIVFPTTLNDSNDIVYAMAFGSTGEAIVADLEYIGDGSTSIFSIPNTRISVARQVYVKINGDEVSNYDLTWDSSVISPWTINTQYYINDLMSYSGKVYKATEDFFSGAVFDDTAVIEYDYYAAIAFDVPPEAGDYVQVHVYDQATTRKAYSSIKEVNYTVAKTGLISGDAVSYPGDYVFALPETMQYAQPWNTNIIVRINNEELSPANNTYYVGDESTVSFIVPMVSGHTANTFSDTDLQVVVDGVAKSINIDYTIYRDGSSINPVVIFNSPPAADSQICFSDRSVSDYTFVDSNNIRIRSTLFIKNDDATNLKVDDTITIIQFSNHDMYNQRTQVFKGLTASSTMTGGFDAIGFDAAAFDSDTVSIVSSPVYNLGKAVANADYIMVFLNGAITNQVYDYRIEDGTILTMSNDLSIGANDVLTIRQFSEVTRKPTVQFRYFKNMRDQVDYLGIGADSVTELAQNLEFTDTSIVVEDASKLMAPSLGNNDPGVIFVNGERITYWTRNLTTNTLGQIRRSTAGTGSRFHAAGSRVEDGGASMYIPDGDKLWYSLIDGGQIGPDGSTLVVQTTGESLQSINTVAANYLRSISR